MTEQESDEIKRHFDVVAEGLRSEIRLVAEGVAMNTEGLDRLAGRVGTVETKVDRLEGELHAFRDETRHNFSELRSTIELSRATLDR
jgi:hypothetical protein